MTLYDAASSFPQASLFSTARIDDSPCLVLAEFYDEIALLKEAIDD